MHLPNGSHAPLKQPPRRVGVLGVPGVPGVPIPPLSITTHLFLLTFYQLTNIWDTWDTGGFCQVKIWVCGNTHLGHTWDTPGTPEGLPTFGCLPDRSRRPCQPGRLLVMARGDFNQLRPGWGAAAEVRPNDLSGTGCRRSRTARSPGTAPPPPAWPARAGPAGRRRSPR